MMGRATWRRFSDARLVVAALVLAGYWVAGRGAGNFYPFSRFPMYAGSAGKTATRLMALTADNQYVEITQFDRWACDDLGHLDETKCEDAGAIGYIDREREDHIRSHPGTGGAPIKLVRRVFSFDGKTRAPHCVITQCTAVRR